VTSSQSERGSAAAELRGGHGSQHRPLFRPRQLILRDGDQVRGILLRPWMQKAAALMLLGGVAWGVTATIAVYHHVVEAEVAAEAYRLAIADMARQQLRMAEISRGLAGQRAALDRLRQRQDNDGSHPLTALEGEVADLLGKVAELETALDGISATLAATMVERHAIAREREQMAERMREIERRGLDRTRELERELAAAHAAHEEAIASLGQRTRATIAEVERLLTSAGLDPARMLPAPSTERARRGGRGGPFVPAATPGSSQPPPPQDRSDEVLHDVEWLQRLTKLVASSPLSAPLAPGYQVESGFGRRTDPIRGRPAFHTGIDLSDDYGTAVFATAPGVVTVAGWEGSYGRVVEIDHGYGLRTRYAHLASMAVQVDQRVDRFTRIGAMGNSGRSTGTHLHYEVLLNGQHLNPARLLRGSYVRNANQGNGSGR
jgi:murein DD-endopeptidase MepM/ murein hydrolase activator NlpD